MGEDIGIFRWGTRDRIPIGVPCDNFGRATVGACKWVIQHDVVGLFCLQYNAYTLDCELRPVPKDESTHGFSMFFDSHVPTGPAIVSSAAVRKPQLPKKALKLMPTARTAAVADGKGRWEKLGRVGRGTCRITLHLA